MIGHVETRQRSAAGPGVVPQHLAVRHHADAVPAHPEGSRSGRPRTPRRPGGPITGWSSTRSRSPSWSCLNPEGTRLLRSWRHVEHCPQCGGEATAELSVDELRSAVAGLTGPFGSGTRSRGLPRLPVPPPPEGGTAAGSRRRSVRLVTQGPELASQGDDRSAASPRDPPWPVPVGRPGETGEDAVLVVPGTAEVPAPPGDAVHAPVPGAAARTGRRLRHWLRRRWPVLRFVGGAAAGAGRPVGARQPPGRVAGVRGGLQHPALVVGAPRGGGRGGVPGGLRPMEQRLLRAGGLGPPFNPLLGMTVASQAMRTRCRPGPAVASVYGFRWFRRFGADESSPGGRWWDRRWPPPSPWRWWRRGVPWRPSSRVPAST